MPTIGEQLKAARVDLAKARDEAATAVTGSVKVHQIDADIPSLRTVVKFRNLEQNCMVIAANKAKSDAKNFREAAAIMQGIADDRAKVMSEWLLERAVAFEKCESDDGEAR